MGTGRKMIGSILAQLEDLEDQIKHLRSKQIFRTSRKKRWNQIGCPNQIPVWSEDLFGSQNSTKKINQSNRKISLMEPIFRGSWKKEDQDLEDQDQKDQRTRSDGRNL